MKKIDERYFIKPQGSNPNESIEAVLDSEEKILWRGKPCRKSFILSAFFKMLPFVLIWILFDGGFIAALVLTADGLPWYVYLIIALFFLFHLVPVWFWIAGIIGAGRRQKLEEYAFTDRRIVIKKGLISSNIESISYESVSSVNLKIGFVEKLCHVGDIYIFSEGNRRSIIEDIADPYFIYGSLQKIAADIKADIIYPNSYRPDANPGFKTSYSPDQEKKSEEDR